MKRDKLHKKAVPPSDLWYSLLKSLDFLLYLYAI